MKLLLLLAIIILYGISRADVADFMLKQLTDDTYLGATAAVCWCESLGARWKIDYKERVISVLALFMK